MEKLKNLKIVLLLLLVVLILVIVKSTGKNPFKQDAQEAIEAVKSNNFSVNTEVLKGNENQYLIVDLSELGEAQFENGLKIPFEKLLDESNLKKLKESEKRVLLVSDEHSKAEKAWVILNQLGYKNVFVLSNEENPEVLNYEFKPDAAARLETNSE